MKYLMIASALLVAWYVFWLRQLHKMLGNFDKEWLHRDWEGWSSWLTPSDEKVRIRP